jgi:hypothetical protein
MARTSEKSPKVAMKGAIKYAISADKRDILSSNSDEADAKVRRAEQRIADGEERVARIRGLIARLRPRGFDKSVADKLLVTMTESLPPGERLRCFGPSTSQAA